MVRPGAPNSSPLNQHTHEWRVTDGSPYIEDGAAIFIEECTWAEVTSSVTSERHDETFYGYGAECDAQSTQRMEIESLTKRREGGPNITYLASEFDRFSHIAELALIDVENYGEVTDVNPSRNFGEVTVETDDWIARYEA